MSIGSIEGCNGELYLREAAAFYQSAPIPLHLWRLYVAWKIRNLLCAIEALYFFQTLCRANPYYKTLLAQNGKV